MAPAGKSRRAFLRLESGTKAEQSGAMDVTIVTASRPETTASVTRGAARLLGALGYAPLTEVTLPNGRRADLMALGPKGQIFIIEVKSGVEDFRVDLKWPEYQPYCDAFAFAVAPEFPREILPEEPGLIVADGFGGAILREARVTPLAGARRKALTLAFARLAAYRAAGVVATEL
jgi:hypothetical protein